MPNLICCVLFVSFVVVLVSFGQIRQLTASTAPYNADNSLDEIVYNETSVEIPTYSIMASMTPKKRRSKRMQSEIQYTMNNLAKIDKFFVESTHHFDMITDCNQKLALLKNEVDQINLKELESLQNEESRRDGKTSLGGVDTMNSLINNMYLRNIDQYNYAPNDLEFLSEENASSARTNSSPSKMFENVKKQLVDYLK